MYSHIVIFWTDPDNPAAADELIAGARKYLEPIPDILHFHIGRAVPSNRPVVDSTYQVGLNVIFPSREARQAYREHSLHHEFEEKVLKRCYKRCVVYHFE